MLKPISENLINVLNESTLVASCLNDEVYDQVLADQRLIQEAIDGTIDSVSIESMLDSLRNSGFSDYSEDALEEAYDIALKHESEQMDYNAMVADYWNKR